MFTEERYQYILKELQATGKVLVKNLSVELKISESMVRKDLQALEKKKLLQRTYGGAIRLNNILATPEPFLSRSHKDTNIKEQVAKKALTQINDHDMIFLDASTTSYIIAKHLINRNRPLTVVTNMYEISSLIPEDTKTKFFFIGGEYSAIIGGSMGTFANEQIQSYRCNKAFIGCVGMSLQDGNLTTALSDDASLKRCILSISETSYLLMLNDKFNCQSNFIFANASDFSCIITESRPEDTILDALTNYSVTLL